MQLSDRMSWEHDSDIPYLNFNLWNDCNAISRRVNIELQMIAKLTDFVVGTNMIAPLI